MNTFRIIQSALKQAKEEKRRKAAILSLKASPLNYGIIQEMANAAWNYGRAMHFSIRLADGSVLDIKPMDEYDVKKATEEIARNYWEGNFSEETR